MNIEIRTLKPDELTAWFDFLSREIFPGDPRDVIEGMWYNDAEKDFGGIFIAADPEGRIVGSVKAECCMLPVLGQPVRGGIVSGVGTKAGYRGQGISRRLFAACHSRLLEKDAVIAHLYSKPDTLDFYLRLGYRNLPQREGEPFFRMYCVLKPFAVGGTPVPDSDSLAERMRKETKLEETKASPL
jgi:predicted N-acetyltransferase YhbS